MHSALRIGIEAAAARVLYAVRIAFAMLCLFANELRATLARCIAYGAALGALGLIATEIVTTRLPVVADTPDRQDWIEVGKAFPAFAMRMPDLEAAPDYAIWRNTSNGGRKDILAFGDPQSGATAIVEIHRPAASEEAADDGDITASIAQLRLSGPRAAPNTIDTKFGEVLVEPFSDSAPTGERRCLRFSRNFEEPRLEISGWFCNGGAELVDRGMIACAFDHLTLIAGASEPKLAALFARAELKRNFCGQQSVFLAATRKRTDWIEAARDPKLRGRAN